MQFLEERGKYLFSILKDISQSDNLKVPISDDVLCVVHYAEVMLKYFTFGTSKDIPYATFKFCLRSDTEKKSLDDRGIVCFKDMQNLRTDVSSFLIQSKPLIGVRDYFRGIPNFKTYLKTILATTYNTEGTFLITLADQQHLIDDLGFDADEIITFLSKIEYFLKILAISARTYCGVQSEVSRSLVSTNAFETESIKHALSRKKSRNERVRLRVNGTIDPGVVMHSMKRPLTRFGQILLSSAFNPGEIEHPLLSRLLMYFVERHVELYPAAFIYADNYFAFNDSQYKWLKVLAFPKPKTISTQTEESSPIVPEEPKLFTMTDLKDLLANVHAIADVFAAKEPHHPLSTLRVQVQCTPDIYLPTANDNRADNSTLHLEDSVDLTSDLETPSTSPMSKSADVSAARRFSIPMSPLKIRKSIDPNKSTSPSSASSSKPVYNSLKRKLKPLKKAAQFSYTDQHNRIIATHGARNIQLVKGNVCWRQLLQKEAFVNCDISEVALRKKFLRMVENGDIENYLSQEECEQIRQHIYRH